MHVVVDTIFDEEAPRDWPALLEALFRDQGRARRGWPNAWRQAKPATREAFKISFNALSTNLTELKLNALERKNLKSHTFRRLA
jgi:hypothetical protein